MNSQLEYLQMNTAWKFASRCQILKTFRSLALNTVLQAYFTFIHYVVQIMVLQFGEQCLINGKAL